MALTKEDIIRHIHSGAIKVTRAQDDELTGIYATKEVQGNIDPMQVQSAIIQPSTREQAPFDLGNNIYHLSTSDFIREYGDEVLANAQQPITRRKPSSHILG
jgi:hypothetical protein